MDLQIRPIPLSLIAVIQLNLLIFSGTAPAPITKLLKTTDIRHPKKAVERAIFHKLCDDYYRMTACNDAFQVNDVRVVELTHDTGFRQKIKSVLVRRPSLQSFYCNSQRRFNTGLSFQLALAYVAKFA